VKQIDEQVNDEFAILDFIQEIALMKVCWKLEFEHHSKLFRASGIIHMLSAWSPALPYNDRSA
jgi:hypothetical protein